MAKSIIPHTKWSASKTALLNLLIEHGGQTIAELSSSLGVSVPYTTKTLNELIEDGLIEVTGKKDNYSKRAPKIYDLIATSGYFLGIDTGKQSLTFGICDFCGNMVAEPELIHLTTRTPRNASTVSSTSSTNTSRDQASREARSRRLA